ncbi:major facilitator superfamily domain-containing protein [Papiliotrema laurentii]|uniref:Major facilitator superfamily domain-containing protein n=1 Tax=Papiliotrema laurentii TaxID=5418 RepID=A0AAD9FQG0_PAPLA|nr:major facilitator superfamily domain-containing protein [Papiliotrema laurentii]
MSPPSSEIIHATQHRPSPSASLGALEMGKSSSEHVEHVAEVDIGQDVIYHGGDDATKPRTGLRKLLRRNPSLEFIREVAIENTKELDPVEVAKVEKKLFWLIVPALAVDYAFYYIDKTTLSYAAIFGIKKELHLGGERYSNLSSIFYIGWLAWAIPGNLLLSKFPLAKYLSVNIFFWGVFLMAQAGSQSYEAMLAFRFVSGMFEAVADPCFVAITGMWFTRKQQPTIIGYWYTANGVGIAIGGLIGFGIGHIGGALSSWKYEFLIIGAACSLWAIVMAIIIPDAPHHTRWLTRREAVVVMSRKRHDHHTVEKRQLRWEQVWECAKDPKVYLFFLLGLFANIPNGATSNFGTLVIKGFGFDTLQTTLLQIPYGSFIAIMILLSVYINHLTNHMNVRTYFMAGITCITVIGFAMLAFTDSVASRLIGYYLTGSSNAAFVLGLSLVSGNVGGSTKKVLASAAIFIGVAVGNIIGPYAFIDSEAPGYHTGIIVCMVSRVCEIFVILALRLCFVIPNRNRDAKFRAGDARYDPVVQEFDDITDMKNLHFRYVA